MNAFKTLASLALLLPLVQAAIYVTNPVASTVCHGGQPCDVAWVDDGQSPLLSSIGECTVGLYNGEMVLVQSLTSVDVSSTTSLSFTPNPSAGANGDYYLVFTSNSIDYQGWSATFTLDSMTGSAGSGNSTSAGVSTTTTSTLPGSSSGSASASTSTGTTTIVTESSASSTSTFSSGTVSATTLSATTSTLTTSTSVTSSGISTITTPSSSATSSGTHTSSASTTSATQSGAAIRAGASTSLAGGFFLALAGALAF